MNENEKIIADRVTDTIGSGRFILIQSIILISYILYQSFVTSHYKFDPYPFILLNLLLSFQAAYTGPFVLWSQNRQAKKDEERSQKTYEMVEQELRIVKRELILAQKEREELRQLHIEFQQLNKELHLKQQRLMEHLEHQINPRMY